MTQGVIGVVLLAAFLLLSGCGVNWKCNVYKTKALVKGVREPTDVTAIKIHWEDSDARVDATTEISPARELSPAREAAVDVQDTTIAPPAQ